MSNRRYRKYIDRPFQGRIAVTVVINAMMYMFLLALFLFVPLAYRIDHETVSSEMMSVGKDFITLHEHFWPAIFVLLILVAFQSIRLSHRIAGPIYRFKLAIQSMKKRDFSQKITLRKKDFLVDLMKEINEMSVSLQETFQELKNKNALLGEEIDALNHQLVEGDISPEDLKLSLMSIQKRQTALNQCLEGIQLDQKNV